MDVTLPQGYQYNGDFGSFTASMGDAHNRIVAGMYTGRYTEDAVYRMVMTNLTAQVGNRRTITDDDITQAFKSIEAVLDI